MANRLATVGGDYLTTGGGDYLTDEAPSYVGLLARGSLQGYAELIDVSDFIITNYVLDNGLLEISNSADKLYICWALPNDFNQATDTFALGNKNFGLGNVASQPVATALGRKVTTNAIIDGTETSSGTAVYWAIVDSANTRLLAHGPLAASRVISGNGLFRLPAIDIDVPNSA